jgi:ubiquitin-conjugating enzyme E2 Z
MAFRYMKDLQEIYDQSYRSIPLMYVATNEELCRVQQHAPHTNPLAPHNNDFSEVRAPPPCQQVSRNPQVFALIVGPPDTPYANCFFFVRLTLPAEYPNKPPSVTFLTTGNGRVRLNPNIYSSGQLCLSVLGTWRGETDEEWRSSYSIRYLLQCMQFMVLVEEPYYNEPGFKEGSDRASARESEAYSTKIMHESLRLGVCETMEMLLGISSPDPPPSPPQSRDHHDEECIPSLPTLLGEPEPSPGITPSTTPLTGDFSQWPSSLESAVARAALQHRSGSSMTALYLLFASPLRRLFLVHYPSYLRMLDTIHERVQAKGAPDGAKDARLPRRFIRCPFESSSNGCFGAFEEEFLRERLQRIYQVVVDEEERVLRDGVQWTALDYCSAKTLLREAQMIGTRVPLVAAAPVDPNNAYVWSVTVLHCEYEPLSGSAYTFRVVYPSDLSVAPFVRTQQPIFHPHVNAQGVPLYFLEENQTIAADSRYLQQHLCVLLWKLLSEAPNPSPTSWCNEEAARLCFSNDPEEQRAFKRRARAFAERTTE